MPEEKTKLFAILEVMHHCILFWWDIVAEPVEKPTHRWALINHPPINKCLSQGFKHVELKAYGIWL